ncbi:kinase-like domain-containing protein [Mycena leptocephala]|nr:kinase-like domain-containing protein [Mycena leptocephala]
MIKTLSKFPMIPQADIRDSRKKDNCDIVNVMKQLFEIHMYKIDIALTIPDDQAFAVLNLTHSILNGGLPEDSPVNTDAVFIRRAKRLLSILADQLKLLPEKLAMNGVWLLDERPVKYGGFSDIYHGRYMREDGKEVEVALKVLKIFNDQSDDARRILHEKFAKEALSWSLLHHPNVVPFLGVDSWTFPGHTTAMVSEWMARGSILSYMLDNSPCSEYAIKIIHDIIQGIMYLHSVIYSR